MKSKPSIIFSSLIILSIAIFIGLTQYDGIGKSQKLPNVFLSHIVFNNNNLPQRFIKYRFAISKFFIQLVFNKEIQLVQMQYSVLNYSSGILLALNYQTEIELVKDLYRDLPGIIQTAENSEEEGII